MPVWDRGNSVEMFLPIKHIFCNSLQAPSISITNVEMYYQLNGNEKDSLVDEE
jgi:hypothetical protein